MHRLYSMKYSFLFKNTILFTLNDIRNEGDDGLGGALYKSLNQNSTDYMDMVKCNINSAQLAPSPKLVKLYADIINDGYRLDECSFNVMDDESGWTHKFEPCIPIAKALATVRHNINLDE